MPCIKPEELTVLTDEWRIYPETDIPEEWAQKDGSAVRVDQYWSKVLKLKSVSGSQKFSMLGKVIKCALSLSHGNADNERSLSINKNTLSKERSRLSITALNGLRAVEDGVRNEGELSNVAVNKGMLVSVKSSHKAYLAHIEEERMKIHKRENLLKRNSRKGKPREGKKRNWRKLMVSGKASRNWMKGNQKHLKCFNLLVPFLKRVMKKWPRE